MTALRLPPEGRPATEPPEESGLARDEVRLMAVHATGVRHRLFRDLPDLLEPGDLVVVNTSPTWPARLDVRRADGGVVPLHVSTELDDGSWVVELRRPDNSGPDLGAEPGTDLALPGGVLPVEWNSTSAIRNALKCVEPEFARGIHPGGTRPQVMHTRHV